MQRISTKYLPGASGYIVKPLDYAGPVAIFKIIKAYWHETLKLKGGEWYDFSK